MESPAESLSARVRAQYEALPYPAYGLFLPLRTQEAYASHSLFAARLAEQCGRVPALRRSPRPEVLWAGCGDAFPYLAAHWEPRRHRLTALDISARSLRRARLRCLALPRSIAWRRGDLSDPAFPLPEGLAHIDCYGVLHHLARPAEALARLTRSLAPGGTLRIMVYNSAARGWLRHVQQAFSLLGLEGTDPEDRRAARSLLDTLAAASPALRDRLAAMGDVFSHPARFTDTFLHAREARLDWAYWRRAAEAAGLSILGLYDRCGELDDLPNPLLEPPGPEPLAERIADRRFENNLELYLARAEAGDEGPRRREAGTPPSLRPLSAFALSAFAIRTPPRSWWGYRETRELPWGARLAAWRHFLANVAGRRRRADAWAARLPPRAFARLGRLGAVWPDECESAELKALLRAPLEPSMEPPDFPPRADVKNDPVLRARLAALAGRKGKGPGLGEAALARLDAAQRP